MQPQGKLFLKLKNYRDTVLFEPRREKTGFLHMRKQSVIQLRGNREADQRLCFRYIDNSYNPSTFYKQNFQHLAIFCGCTARFVSDQVRIPEDRFSHNEAHLGIKNNGPGQSTR